MFVSVEGIEGSGKTTVVREVAGRLRADRWSVDLLRDFATPHFRTPVETAVRKSLFFSLGFEDGPRAALLYMLYHEAAKWDRAAPSSRDVMIADRFLDSIVAYQGQFVPSQESNDAEKLERRTAGLLRQIGIPIPDRTYLLDVPIELSVERFAGREGRCLTDFELTQLTQIRASLLILARVNPRFLVIDAGLPLDDVVKIVLAICGRAWRTAGTPVEAKGGRWGTPARSRTGPALWAPSMWTMHIGSTCTVPRHRRESHCLVAPT